MCCYGDDAKQDTTTSLVDDFEDQQKKTGWCVDDSAAEMIFYPEATRNKYVVVGLGGATIRMGPRLDSPVMKTLPQGSIVVVDQVRARRAHISKPLDGWASLSTESGYIIMEAIARPTKYRVVFREGIFVRSTASIEDGRIVKIAPYGTVLNATGKTEIFDGVERVQVDGGWVSMRLREDRGAGAPLIMPLN